MVTSKQKIVYQGLTQKQAEKRLREYGYNELEEKKRITPVNILTRQFTNFIVWVLFAAAVISAFIGEVISFWVVLFIVCFVIILGFFQEYKAEKAMESLKKIVQQTANVLRDGKVGKIQSREIVVGDVLVLDVGEKIPADAKIFDSNNLRVDESILTGESISVKKNKGDLIFAGTLIVNGKCKAIVTATGMKTKLGKIAELIQEAEEKTPLQIKITQLAKTLALIALISCAIVFIIGILKGAPITGILIVALALAVAAVPEGLPLTLTLTLSSGMKNMAKHNAIIRKMLAVEALGSTTVICTDKTGTLTKNEMTVEKIFVNDKIVNISGVGYEPKGEFFVDEEKINPKYNKTLTLLLKSSVLCNNASLERKDSWKIFGDPTEACLVVLSAKAGLWKDELEKKYHRIEEIIFTSERKMMSTVHKKDEKKIAFIKGAPEIILKKSKYIQKDNNIIKLGKHEINKIIKVNKQFTSSALRVLAVGYKKVSGPLTPKNIERDIIFLGLVAMIDMPREEVSESIKTCKNAGIKVVMITGDNPETAKAVAKKIGLFEINEKLEKINDAKLRRIVKDGIITGNELSRLSEKEFERVVEEIIIYARIVPEQKLRIVKALKKKGHIVAMTGDGINDAPAIKKADVGIAMGIKGTDVTREASDMVLQDDNFATIVEAVKGGRTIYENIEKFTCYLISQNFTEVILISLGIMIFGFEFLPLIALQILLINTFDEGLFALSLGLDPGTKEVMLKPPKKPGKNIITKRNSVLVFSLAIFMAIMAFLVFVTSNPFSNIEKARTLTFATIINMILFVPFAFRSLEESIFKIGFLTNKLLIIAVITIGLITLSVMYSPLREMFKLTALSLADWIIPLATGFAALIFMEGMKFITKKIR